MTTIYKYTLAVRDSQSINTYEGAKFLHVAEQHGRLTVWAQVDTLKPPTQVQILIVGTGNPMWPRDDLQHIGSAICGPFVWHVFTPRRNNGAGVREG